MQDELVDSLIVKNEKKILFLVMDGLGGLPVEGRDKTELEAARTPNLDRLAKGGVCGLLDPIGPGITPGSGPAHFALFGYDPVKNNVGRGILGAAGLDFPMTEKDLFMRVNFATVDAQGIIRDRRAGRIDTDTNRRLCGLLREKVKLPGGVQTFFETEKEHRALFVLRGDGLREEIEETDPQKTGLPPLAPRALVPEAETTAALLRDLAQQARDILRAEPKANMVLLRGYACFHKFPGVGERFGLKPLAVASYPMYRGIARLLGMSVHKPTNTIREEFEALRGAFANYDFFFVHVKPTDSRGEDGQYEQKVKVIEEVDALLPLITDLKPDVLVVTGDHSTPAALASHSWHPVPVLLSAGTCRPDRVERFGESDCLAGGLGRMPMKQLMAVALAHAGKLEKFGA
ncbi:MAG: cofactor-independent phosphoglycerate mutase [Syntrophaceae bacterium PtaU1.Bin231]|nr:MAG: cofactor-independent phosphoglycerate mutase [Syntrophaceae bacterium PtaU1.Bin231]